MNNYTKYGFNNLIISGSYGGHRRHTTDNAMVWHKLPTGELKRGPGVPRLDSGRWKYYLWESYYACPEPEQADVLPYLSDSVIIRFVI